MEKRIAAVYNTWDDWDLLKLSIENIRPLVDEVFVVFSTASNYGEISLMPHNLEEWSCKFIQAEPLKGRPPRDSETAKRNLGLDTARRAGFTHFVMMDADEFYDHEEFKRDYARFDNPDLLGLVVRTRVYFKSPCLTVGFDTTLVPFIHKITPGLRFEFNRKYPFAWDKNLIKIDPTRSMNINSGVELSDTVMHHYSWVRKDIQKKIRNSTARMNIEQSTIVRDYTDAKPGYYCQFYKAVLQTCENKFNIPVNDYYSESSETGISPVTERLLEKDNPLR